MHSTGVLFFSMQMPSEVNGTHDLKNSQSSTLGANCQDPKVCC
jgi:hypothetical protein